MKDKNTLIVIGLFLISMLAFVWVNDDITNMKNEINTNIQKFSAENIIMAQEMKAQKKKTTDIIRSLKSLQTILYALCEGQECYISQ